VLNVLSSRDPLAGGPDVLDRWLAG
jgi:hypothetical protein